MENDSTEDRQMFEVTCSECGNPAQVPFEPSQGRPVYCEDCFKKTRSSGGGGAQGGNRPMYDATCAECGTATQVPFQPTQGRPVYCREHYKRDR